MTDITDLRAGVVGTGFIGVVHVDALRRLGVTVAGVVGSSPERAAAKAAAPVYDSYEALLGDESVDVVHLTTPNNLHYPQVKQALAAGKHVVCEKPLAMTSAESGELLGQVCFSRSSSATLSRWEMDSSSEIVHRSSKNM
jgi:predicted dehydrogenase